MKIYRLTEADKQKARFFSWIEDEDKRKELIGLYCRQEVPNNIIDWQHIKDYSVEELEKIVKDFLKAHEEKKSKKNLSKALEGRDYIKVFENKNNEGTEYLYLPLTWVGSKYLASDHFLPKIKVPSKVMQANDFADNSAKNWELSPGAKWCISLWTIPDLVIKRKPFKDENGKELRHEGKRYWLNYTVYGIYFLFYFRDYEGLDDIYKKIAFTLNQGSSKIVGITLADDTRGRITTDIEGIQKYWDEHFQEYESQIKHIREVSIKDKPEFDDYEKQKEKEAKKIYEDYRIKSLIKEHFIYNEETGRYDSKKDVSRDISKYLIKYGKFTIPLGVIHGNFDCKELKLKTLKNGPTEVTGYFNCSHNNLTTLEYAPKEVGGDFYCSWNNLTTLEYAPQKVGWGFSCNNNYLTTLEGAPKEVEGSFNCHYNQLTSLEYAPKKVGRVFDCHNNKLTSLKGSPKKIGWSFDCSNNNLTTLEGSPDYVEGSFYCSDNQLTTLEGAPQEVMLNFICGNNPLQSRELSTNVRGIVYY